MGYSGARGTLIYEKNLKAKISCETPFKRTKKGGLAFGIEAKAVVHVEDRDEV